MKSKLYRTFSLSLIGTISYFLVGWLVFDLLIGNYTDANTIQVSGFKKSEEDFSMLFLIISCGAYATLMSILFVYWLDIKSLTKSYTFGAIVGILIAIMTDMYWYASSNFYSNGMVVLLDVMAAGFTVGFLALIVNYFNLKWESSSE